MEVISKINGFNAYYVVKAGEDTLATVSVFTDKSGAVLSNQAAARWVKENAADLFSGTVDAVTGEVVAYLQAHKRALEVHRAPQDAGRRVHENCERNSHG